MTNLAPGGKQEIKTIGILLLNLGGPDSLQAVRPFLYNLFSDREIIRLGPAMFQKPLARLISMFRAKKTEKMYNLIGGKSPILQITLAQADSLQKALSQGLALKGQEFLDEEFEPLHNVQKSPQRSLLKVYVGMRYWNPFIEDTIQKIYGDGIRAVLAVTLYPHYSLATTGSALRKFNENIRRYPMEASSISSWCNHPYYIDALVERIRRGIDSFQGEKAEVLFSAHSLPVSIVESGDPYVDHILGTIGEVAKRTALQWHLSYQSKSGPVKWLEPSTENALRKLAREGVRNVLVVPISFVSDHIETLYEIDILYKELAASLGIRLIRAESLNTHPLLIKALEDMVTKKVKELGWTE
ncbi:MAG TPA: ferrochelatase [Thermodesulfovibrionales bacterium]|nr:ferrochelatase [Thermodesulfovibrionales bacterium]